MLNIDVFSPNHFYTDMLYRSIHQVKESRQSNTPVPHTKVFLLPDDRQCLAMSFLPELIAENHAIVMCTESIYRILKGLLYGHIIQYPALGKTQKIFINTLINKLIDEMYKHANRNILHYANKISPIPTTFSAENFHLKRLLQQMAVAEQVIGIKEKNEQSITHVFGLHPCEAQFMHTYRP